jgi:hypothetical protein
MQGKVPQIDSCRIDHARQEPREHHEQDRHDDTGKNLPREKARE